MAAARGNKYAAKAKDWEAALKRSLARRYEGDWRRGLDAVADATVELAIAKERWAIEEIGSRIDGKPAQSVEVSGEVTQRHVNEIPDDQLADIATGGRAGVTEAAGGEKEPAPVH